MPILQDAKRLSIYGGDFTDVQGSIINYHGIQESEQGVEIKYRYIVVYKGLFVYGNLLHTVYVLRI
jgi:hypothetical protein